jgi:hypothetical protein
MKVGIFGDSYASHIKEHVGESWVSLIQSDPSFDITVHAKPGASGFWIYREYLKHYKNYDKIIYIVTYPHRLSLTFGTVASLNNLDYHLGREDSGYSPSQIVVLRAIRDYLTYAMTDSDIEDQHTTWHHLMLDKVKQTKKEILMIPAFQYNNSEFSKYLALWQITQFEEMLWGPPWHEYLLERGRRGDNRQCHLTETNNKILYNIIADKIKSLNEFTILDLQKNDFPNAWPNEPLEKYKSTN